MTRRVVLGGVSLFLAPVKVVTCQAFPASVASLVDSSRDPCTNFYQFSCGAWLAAHEIASDRSMMEYSFNTAQNAVDATMMHALATDSTSLVGALYASCMNMDARNAIGAEPLQEGIKSIVQAQDKKELFLVAGRLARTGADLITNVSPESSYQNASRTILWVSHADLTLDDEYFKNPQILKHVERNLSHYASTVLNLTGFALNTSEYEDYGQVVLNIEKQLIELQLYTQLDPVSTDVCYLFKYKEAAANYPLVFGAYAAGMDLLQDAPALTEQSELAFLSIMYFEKAEELVSLLSLDALKVYVAFTYVNGYAQYLSESFITARFKFFRETMLGIETPRPLENICVNHVITLLPVHAGDVYVAQRNDIEETRTAFIAMLGEVVDAMESNIRTLEWLDERTRTSALAKLDSLEILYVQPDPRQLEKEAQGLGKLDPTAFFANVDLIHRAQFRSLASAIGTDVDRNAWGMSAASVNAYYSPFTNQIVFPAGILQQPFFELNSQAAKMFGSVGVIAGHEISHGFDTSGSNFDEKGNWKSWWTSTTAAEFLARAQCLNQQYSSFYVEAAEDIELVPVDGKKTLGENIADNGGLGVAYKAYRKHVTSRNNSNNSSDNSMEDQLFFVSYAQTWCGKVRGKTALDSFLTDSHAVGEARVNGAAMNSAAFAKAFDCPAGTPMNPVNKCVLW
ncbi:hypothetical protein PsorP6_001922 [Peronosclerospora sorghi]|uniref:Uncharacterized protein n=1 Tax=Peronosclerospora sorghi TaxID=230839 RepID=A0ACC0WUQ8_9STRA|nr:hypothetical protein PsorP6_001922 [Peronosclerospora sorghi]